MFDLSSWKYSFELVSRELELTKKKKQALDDLLAADRISQPTYEYLERELSEALLDLEAREESLIDKMNARASGLEKQIETLELFLANLEIHHAAEEIDEETYNCQNDAITLGLEATKKELEGIKNSLVKIVPVSPKLAAAASETPEEAEVEEAAPENIPESSVETKPTEEESEEGATEEDIGYAEPESRTLMMPQGERSTETGLETPY